MSLLSAKEAKSVPQAQGTEYLRSLNKFIGDKMKPLGNRHFFPLLILSHVLHNQPSWYLVGLAGKCAVAVPFYHRNVTVASIVSVP